MFQFSIPQNSTIYFNTTNKLLKIVDLASDSVRIYLYHIETYLKLSGNKIMGRMIKSVQTNQI